MVDRITVRMYEVGFGDSFLLQFFSAGEVRRVLIDCGSITEGQEQVDRVVDDIISTCRTGTGRPRIDLVVATHRHKDHVGGFANPKWVDVEVGEVWMPWTEDPDDPRASYIRNRQSALATALTAGLSDPDPLAVRVPVKSEAEAKLKAQQSIPLNALTNEKAMATLHGGFANQPKPAFLPLKDVTSKARTIAGIAGVTVHVLGPPHDEKALAIMDPPSGGGYLTTSGQGGGPGKAFDDRWVVTEAVWRTEAQGTTFTPEHMKAINGMADQPTGALAAALDNALNNTSLILLFEIGENWLLFPADAQWGSWNVAMSDPVSRALLQKATFYKVGHHGSHNATPKALIEEIMAPGFTAMFSTCSVPQWPQIPREPLVQAIKQKSKRYARSDNEAESKVQGFTVEPGLYVEIEFPTP